MTNEEILSKLKSNKWSNKYFCKLVIWDHIRECLEKDNYLKALDVPKTDERYQLLDKELMDLKIVLDFYFDGSEDLYHKRLEKYLANIDK